MEKLNIETLKTLKESYQKNKLVAFVGSGMSIESGIPNWNKLICDILNDLKGLGHKTDGYISIIQSGEFTGLEAIDKFEDYRTQILDIMYKLFVERYKPIPNETHRLITKVFDKVITTNYDQLLDETSLEHKVILYDNAFHLGKIADYKKYIIKLHGSINDVNKCILFSKDYKKMYSDKHESAGIFTFQKILSDFDVVFIGFSLTDPYVKEMLVAIDKMFEGYTRNMFFIGQEKPNVLISRLVFIDIQNHKDIYQILTYLDSIQIDKSISEMQDEEPVTKTSSKEGEILFEEPVNYLLTVKHFVGRKDELNRLQMDYKVFFITGFGGQGKSALVSWYISSYIGEENDSMWDWRDFKEEENKFTSQIISLIMRFNPKTYNASILKDYPMLNLVDLLFIEIGSKQMTFVFDNVDRYIDMTTFKPIGGVQVLIEQAMSRKHNAKFIFTCRPFVKIASADCFQLQMTGLTYENTIELFHKYDVPISEKDIPDICLKVHTLTKGHPFWLKLSANQARYGKEEIDKFIKDIEQKTHFDENDLSVILSQDILEVVWKRLNKDCMTFLRSIAETIKPETESNLRTILSKELTPAKIIKSIATLKNLYLIESKKVRNSEEQLELHPLVKEFILDKYPVNEREKYITYFAIYYEKYVYILKQRIQPHQTLDFYERCLATVEFNINKKDFITALSKLFIVLFPIIEDGYVHEYIRVAEKLFDALNWEIAKEQEYQYFETLLFKTITAMTQCGFYDKSQKFIEHYEMTIQAKDKSYIGLLSEKCYLEWYKDNFSQAIEYGEIAERLLNESGIFDEDGLRHNLALARRDSLDSDNLEKSLQYFLKDEDLDAILKEIKPELKADYYGNIGRCLQYKGLFDNALTCFVYSMSLLLDAKREISLLNIGYACLWISEILIKKEKVFEALIFLRFGIIKSEAYSPRIEIMKNQWNRVICDNEIKQHIENMLDSNIEKQCKELLRKNWNDNPRQYSY